MNENDKSLSVAIPKWSSEDFTRTTKPYDWLYEYYNDPFTLKRLTEEVRVMAKDVGITCFITIWKAYLEGKPKADSRVIANVTQFSNQPIELYCGEYSCDDLGVTKINSFGVEASVCRHPIYPVRRFVNIDTGEVKLEIAFRRDGGRWRNVIFDKEILISANKIVELGKHGISVNSTTASSLVDYINFMEDENYDKLGEISSVGRLGWIGDIDFSPYVDGVIFDGEASYRAMYEAVKERGSFDQWLELMREIRKGGLIARLQLAASFASPLIEPLGCLPFFLHTWGGTEAGKTVGLMVAASVWANPDPGQYIKTFNSTQLALTLTEGFLNSLPLCIDELQVLKSKRDFDDIIYKLTEGIGKMQGSRSGGMQRTMTWKNCILTTGEMPISNSSSGGGAVNRIINVDCGSEKLFSDPRRVANTIRRNYGWAGKVFVNNLIIYADQIQGIYSRYYEELSKGEATEKQSASAALLLTADELAERWIFHDGVKLTVEEIAPYLTSRDEVNQNYRAVEWLYDFVAANPNRFKAQDNNGEIWGEIDYPYIYIIKSVFDEKMTEAGFNPTAFLSWAKRSGRLNTEKDRTVKMKRIKGTDINIRCVCFICENDATDENDDDFLDL